MKEAAKYFEGEHDFKGFKSKLLSLNLDGAFFNCINLKTLNIIVLNSDSSASGILINTMANMCYNCIMLESIPTGLCNVMTATDAFYNCISLTTIPKQYIFNLDYKINSSQSRNFTGCFRNCINLTSCYDTLDVTIRTWPQLFYNCSALVDIPLSADFIP